MIKDFHSDRSGDGEETKISRLNCIAVMSNRFDKMVSLCNVCRKHFAGEQSVGRHRKDIHNISSRSVSLNGNACGFKSPSTVGMRRNEENAHSNSLKKRLYCRTTFVSNKKFCEHMTVRHGMPDFATKSYNGPHHVQSSIRGNLKIVKLPANGDGFVGIPKQ